MTLATFSVKTSDGAFDSSVTISLDATEQAKRDVIECWLKLMDSALRCIATIPGKAEALGEKEKG